MLKIFLYIQCPVHYLPKHQIQLILMYFLQSEAFILCSCQMTLYMVRKLTWKEEKKIIFTLQKMTLPLELDHSYASNHNFHLDVCYVVILQHQINLIYFCYVCLHWCDPANKFIGVNSFVEKEKLIVVMKITLPSRLDNLNIATLAFHLVQKFSSPDSILFLLSNFAPLAWNGR